MKTYITWLVIIIVVLIILVIILGTLYFYFKNASGQLYEKPECDQLDNAYSNRNKKQESALEEVE